MSNINSSKDLEVCLSQRDNLEAIFNSVSDGIITTNNDIHILNLNKAAAEYIGIPREKAIGKTYFSVFKNYLGNIEPYLKKVIKTQNSITNFKSNHINKKGIQKKIIINTAILKDREDRNKGLVIVFKDITEISFLRNQLNSRRKFQKVIGKNKKMQEIYKLIESVAHSDASTLIYGESGTGKELAAESIHIKSKRLKGPFIKVNCSALSEFLLESELFGHVKGAFTGSVSDKIGRFELAQKGTIFLDEIADISPAIQVKLLRVVQEKIIERVGDAKPIKVDVRIISATNKDLKKLIAANMFREDLYYRLKVISVTLPPLRERKDDIELLLNHFIKKYNIKTKKNIRSVDNDVLKLFMQYQWKGNVRELENAVEHAFVLCMGDVINPSHIPVEIKEKMEIPSNDKSENEKDVIEAALKNNGWNKTRTAQFLQVNRTTLWRKMKELKIFEGEQG